MGVAGFRVSRLGMTWRVDTDCRTMAIDDIEAPPGKRSRIYEYCAGRRSNWWTVK